MSLYQSHRTSISSAANAKHKAKDWETASIFNQNDKVSARDLVKGARYRTKKDDAELIYLGYYEWFELENEYRVGISAYPSHEYGTTKQVSKGKKHVFVRPSYKKYECYTTEDEFVTPSISTLSHREGDDIDPRFAEYSEKLFSTYNVVKISGIELIPTEENVGRFYVQHENLIGNFQQSRYEVERSVASNQAYVPAHYPNWVSLETDENGNFYMRNYSRVRSYYNYGFNNENSYCIGPIIYFKNK